jgi:hypothetical protein
MTAQVIVPEKAAVRTQESFTQNRLELAPRVG